MPYKPRPPRDPSLPPLKVKTKYCGVVHKDGVKRCDKKVMPNGKHFGPHKDSKHHRISMDLWEDCANHPDSPTPPASCYWA